jgi:hypothetical protein
MCTKLKTLIFNDCFFLDDWLLARLAHQFSDSLEHLEISSSHKVTDAGLLKIAYFKYAFSILAIP